MRITVQLTDKESGKIVYAQQTRETQKVNGDNYAGETKWACRIPFGEMQKPKLSAYVIEFGFMKDSVFIPVAVECDEVELADEITGGEGVKVDMTAKYSPVYIVQNQVRWF